MTMTTAIRIWLLAALAGASVAGTATTALADELPQRTVSFSDLDLSHSAGAAVLYSRIKAAAAQVCDQHAVRSLEAFTTTRRCMDQAIAHAVTEMDVPALTSLYRAKTGQPVIVAQK
jgi:UrcA family protein